jgi:putative tryptophan/tyrosine transport system substrate-binding protein
MTTRRTLIAGLGAAAAWPLKARAQRPTSLVGFLHPQTAGSVQQVVTEFRTALAAAGFVEGRNVAIEYRWAEGHNDRLPMLAMELVRIGPVVIAALGGDSSAFALKAATTSIPIVSVFAADPVRNGFVKSLNRPGGNFTGIYPFGGALEPKRLELLCEMMPDAPIIDVLVNPEGAITAVSTHDLEAAARSLGRQLRIHRATNDREIDTVFATLAQVHSAALQIMGDSFFGTRGQRLAELTTRYRIPTIGVRRDFTTGGGLMNYAAEEQEPFRLAGGYTGRILKGEKPADLPVQQAAKLELVINLKTAKAFGITVSLPLLGRADEVIESSGAGHSSPGSGPRQRGRLRRGRRIGWRSSDLSP